MRALIWTRYWLTTISLWTSSFFIDTETGRYVLTIVEHESFADVEWFMQLLAYLYQNEIPCAMPLQANGGNYTNSLAEKPATVVQCLQGAEADEVELLDEHMQADYAKILAALPQSVIHADLFRDNVLFDGKNISGIIDFYYACLQPQEHTAWPAAVCCAGLRFWLSRLHDLHFPPDALMTFTKDPTPLKQILCEDPVSFVDLACCT